MNRSLTKHQLKAVVVQRTEEVIAFHMLGQVPVPSSMPYDANLFNSIICIVF
uniref:Uncharacterized protein n=1 Tax=Nelumbo nucifera TaxID=4432 RepID=A0A822Y7D1_NELNU|nr:TPA_asm: hypothetical protein HUJ06_028393 [Nelumbo nucifera]